MALVARLVLFPPQQIVQVELVVALIIHVAVVAPVALTVTLAAVVVEVVVAVPAEKAGVMLSAWMIAVCVCVCVRVCVCVCVWRTCVCGARACWQPLLPSSQTAML